MAHYNNSQYEETCLQDFLVILTLLLFLQYYMHSDVCSSFKPHKSVWSIMEELIWYRKLVEHAYDVISWL